MRVDAIVRNFEIIGEAAGKIPEEIREEYPTVEWRKISDFRNVLAHEYLQVDFVLCGTSSRTNFLSLSGR